MYLLMDILSAKGLKSQVIKDACGCDAVLPF